MATTARQKLDIVRNLLRNGKLSDGDKVKKIHAATAPDASPGPTVLKSEDFDDDLPNLARRWGALEHAPDRPGQPSHIELFKTGGPDNGPFIRLRVLANDWQTWNNNQRCEIGRNERRYGRDGGAGTFWLYKEGEETTTEFWSRLNPGWDYNDWNFGGFMQQKQAQPYDPGHPTDTGVAGGLSQEGRQFMIDILWQLHIPLHNPTPDKWFKQSHNVLHTTSDNGFWHPVFDGVDYGKHVHRTLISDDDGPVDSHLRLGPYVPNPFVCYVDIARVRIFKGNAL